MHNNTMECWIRGVSGVFIVDALFIMPTASVFGRIRHTVMGCILD